MTASPSPRFGAILLAGGRASRMGGIDKPGLLVDGVSMRERAIAAVVSVNADPVIVVGPESASGHVVRWVREDPPFSGPAAAVVTALAAMGADAAEWTFLLACDLPRPDAAIAALVHGVRGRDGLCLTDAGGRMQWLTGVYRTGALTDAAAALPGEGRDLPVRALLSGLAVAALPHPGFGARDVDTWEDYDELTKEHP
ncbi:molybdenum cofactor guanylyltransferase [Microbacterium sp. MAHUQ-60]|uniref:molybdenum cofactor guanylyltransferase n=1 Tax=unclassified Microbacterium TaxID=2609290 RepID=UPI003606D5D9